MKFRAACAVHRLRTPKNPGFQAVGGAVKGGVLQLGGQPAMDVPGAQDGKVFVGIRPEGFLPQTDGPLSCTLNSVEVMGRDISVVASHPACQSPTLRAIITADAPVDRNASTVRFALKPEKVFLFQPDSGQRIRGAR